MDVNEQQGSEKWQKFAKNSSESADFQSIWEISSNYHGNYIPNTKDGLNKLKSKIRHEKTGSTKIIRLSPYQKIMRIAAVAIVLIITSFFTYQSIFSDAIITLASGNQKLEAIELPDGSTIWLNKNSELQYPKAFADTERKVILKGEAFFDIAKKPNKPFIIETPNTKTQVVGTSFNIRCFEDEGRDEIQVLTGKVQFSTIDNRDKADLVANERAVFDVKKGSFTKAKEENKNAYAWKTGVLHYKESSLSNVIQQLEKTYDINLDVSKLKVLSCTYSGKFQYNEVEPILDILQATFGFEVKKIRDANFRLIGGSCKAH